MYYHTVEVFRVIFCMDVVKSITKSEQLVHSSPLYVSVRAPRPPLWAYVKGTICSHHCYHHAVQDTDVTYSCNYRFLSFGEHCPLPHLPVSCSLILWIDFVQIPFSQMFLKLPCAPLKWVQPFLDKPDVSWERSSQILDITVSPRTLWAILTLSVLCSVQPWTWFLFSFKLVSQKQWRVFLELPIIPVLRACSGAKALNMRN